MHTDEPENEPLLPTQQSNPPITALDSDTEADETTWSGFLRSSPLFVIGIVVVTITWAFVLYNFLSTTVTSHAIVPNTITHFQQSPPSSDFASILAQEQRVVDLAELDNRVNESAAELTSLMNGVLASLPTAERARLERRIGVLLSHMQRWNSLDVMAKVAIKRAIDSKVSEAKRLADEVRSLLTQSHSNIHNILDSSNSNDEDDDLPLPNIQTPVPQESGEAQNNRESTESSSTSGGERISAIHRLKLAPGIQISSEIRDLSSTTSAPVETQIILDGSKEVNEGSPIPRTIHMSWITETLEGLDNETLQAIQSWRDQNPEYELKVWDECSISAFVQKEFPQFVSELQHFAKIEKLDLFRYLVLLKYGGVYTDIDTVCLYPIRLWDPTHSARMIIGLEADFPSMEFAKSIGAPRKTQFCQWTIAAAPAHPILTDVVNRILLRDGPHKQDDNDRVMETTGPGMWTDTVATYLQSYQFIPADVVEGKSVGDVLFLDIQGFGNSQLHSGSKAFDDPTNYGHAFVHHLFMGTWRHPITVASPKCATDNLIADT
eukprot:c6542_g1_i1.p1 GENE.c6542_g1_i1~~c6542_g1_i1.p1  ORF type:complete len:549 (+),score=158.40 c6542_g1_i1:215-1861(+)